jgi:DNA-binding response OmpR family regulator
MVALQQVLEAGPDAVLLDLGLPDLGGHEALRMIRSVSTVPVLVITARDDEAEIVRALNAGADDYVTKPFGADQIEARIRAVLRRAEAGSPRAGEPLEVGGLRLDACAHEVTLDGVAVDLSRRDLLTHVWRMPYGGADRTVDVHLSWLRRKLGETAQRPRYLHTVRGVGIKLCGPT